MPQIIARYRRGERLRDLAGEYNVCYATLSRRIVAEGELLNKPGRPKGVKSGPVNPEQLREMREMRRKKMTYREIGERFGMTRQGAQQYLRSHLKTKTD